MSYYEDTRRVIHKLCVRRHLQVCVWQLCVKSWGMSERALAGGEWVDGRWWRWLLGLNSVVLRIYFSLCLLFYFHTWYSWLERCSTNVCLIIYLNQNEVHLKIQISQILLFLHHIKWRLHTQNCYILMLLAFHNKWATNSPYKLSSFLFLRKSNSCNFWFWYMHSTEINMGWDSKKYMNKHKLMNSFKYFSLFRKNTSSLLIRKWWKRPQLD